VATLRILAAHFRRLQQLASSQSRPPAAPAAGRPGQR
jgi:hypothetical protein